MSAASDGSKRIVVLISGGGTNLQAILDACADGSLNARAVGVLSNKKKAYGLVRAESAGVPTRYMPLRPFLKKGGSREQYDAQLAELVAGFQPDLVVLAGWMHVLSASFIDPFIDRLINLHPALPGELAGTRAIERAFAMFQQGELQRSGVMVHRVIPEVDAGEPIATAVVPFEDDDTLERFAQRMHAAEHELLVKAIHICLQNP